MVDIIGGLVFVGLILFALYRRSKMRCSCPNHKKSKARKDPISWSDPNASDNYYDGFVDGQGY